MLLALFVALIKPLVAFADDGVAVALEIKHFFYFFFILLDVVLVLVDDGRRIISYFFQLLLCRSC